MVLMHLTRFRLRRLQGLHWMPTRYQLAKHAVLNVIQYSAPILYFRSKKTFLILL